MDTDIINYIKILGLDMINKAGSGHPGIVLGAAPIIYALYKEHLIISPNDPNWINRDRFILSAGHGSALLYATLHMAGYEINMQELKNFRKLGSITPGHPEYGLTPGVDMTTGPLGQGIANAVGISLAGKMHKEKFKIKGQWEDKSLINFKTYVLCGDGDLMEGISYEAMSLAGTLKLNNLIVLYDSNNICLDGETKITFNENISLRMEAINWDYILVTKGSDYKEISKAIKKAKMNERPTLIEIKTIIGAGSQVEGTNQAHGAPLADFDVATIRQKFNIHTEPFEVPSHIYQSFRTSIYENSSEKYNSWANNYKTYNDNKQTKSELSNLISNEVKLDKEFLKPHYQPDFKEATRITNGDIMSRLSNLVPTLVGGAADLSSSTKTYLKDGGIVGPGDYNKKNIFYGVREHAMGAITNGLASVGLRPFASTFLTFSNYMLPSIRLAAIMKLPSTFIFTHDSINIGADGPTHQPIEHLAQLRSIPDNTVLRPADAKELTGCWDYILSTKQTNTLILSRNEYPLIPTTHADMVKYGGYLVKRAAREEDLQGIIISSGTDVHKALIAAINIEKNHGIVMSVVSMVSTNIFERQQEDYKKLLLPKHIKRFVIEAGTNFGLENYATDRSYMITLNDYGVSASGPDVEKHMDFDINSIYNKILEKYRKKEII